MMFKGFSKQSAAEKLTVSSQQSRFHANASATACNKQVIVRDLCITIGQRDLLTNAELNLQPARHYVLIGRNGTGKSTLLTAIGTGLVPGIAPSTKVLLLGQVETLRGHQYDKATTVLEHVVQSDTLREKRLREAHRLSEALNNTSDPLALVTVFRELTLDRLQEEGSEARLAATTTSGVRGAKARKRLQRLEEKVAESARSLAALNDSPTPLTEPASLTSETQQAFDMLAEVQSELEAMNARNAAQHARSILLGLGFTAAGLDQPVAQLSGGWRTRCKLASLLCQSADLLLLDEPTNFLDLPSIIWLERYLKNLANDTTIVVVTHDRAFADSIAHELLIIRDLTLDKFNGNVSAYGSEKLKTYKHMSRMAASQDKQKKQIQSTIDSNVRAAKRAGDDKKLKQAASRQKKLDERMGQQTSAKGTKFKLSRDLAGFHSNRRNKIDVPTFDAPVCLHLPRTPSDLRHPGALLSFEDVSFNYTGERAAVLKSINLVIHPTDRVGLAGLNGSGKSTLVALAMADATSDKPMQPTRGSVSKHPRARIGMYSQTATDELTEIAARDPSLTALSHLMTFAGPDLAEKDARGLLSSLELSPRAQSQVPLMLLSGGQKVRLALAKVLWNPPHLLILDEVTTHLDSDTIQALAVELQKYQGALLVITHDRFFMHCVVGGASLASSAQRGRGNPEASDAEPDSDEEENNAKPGTVYHLNEGVLTRLPLGMQQYEQMAAASRAIHG